MCLFRNKGKKVDIFYSKKPFILSLLSVVHLICPPLVLHTVLLVPLIPWWQNVTSSPLTRTEPRRLNVMMLHLNLFLLISELIIYLAKYIICLKCMSTLCNSMRSTTLYMGDTAMSIKVTTL